MQLTVAILTGFAASRLTPLLESPNPSTSWCREHILRVSAGDAEPERKQSVNGHSVIATTGKALAANSGCAVGLVPKVEN